MKESSGRKAISRIEVSCPEKVRRLFDQGNGKSKMPSG
jgi:hypothetical protein